MHKIQKNVEIPKIHRAKPPRKKYPFDEMEVGDMFFIPKKEKNTLMSQASTVGKKLGRKFLTRMAYMANVDGNWLPCTPQAPDAIIGIAVWRTE